MIENYGNVTFLKQKGTKLACTSNIIQFSVPYSNKMSIRLTEFGPLPLQAQQTVSASACHIGGTDSVNPGQILLVYGLVLV